MTRIGLGNLHNALAPIALVARYQKGTTHSALLCRRLMSNSSTLRASHRTYFQQDSSTNQQSPSQYSSQQQQQHNSQAQRTRQWPLLLIGFAIYPILYLTIENMSVRGLIPESIGHFLFPELTTIREIKILSEHISQLEDAASRYSEMHQATHRLLRDQLTTAPEAERKVVRDDDIIARRPIFLDDGQRVAAKDASLLRVVDEAGHNTLVVLGINLSPYATQQERVDTDIRGLHRWLYQLVEDMHSAGATAFDTEGETMYILYTNNAVAMGPFYVTTLNERSSHTEIIAADSLLLPPGWPLKQLRRVPPCEQTDERVEANNGGPRNPTAQGFLDAGMFPRGPLR